MSDWSAGYVSEIGYTFGYYKQLGVNNVQLSLLHRGYAMPRIETALELGFGQGVSTNIHAAAGSVQWWGTDFNPSQAAFARTLAQASGAHVTLMDYSFEELLAAEDLPQFDYIALHGIWSWISHENRSVIVDVLKSKLNVGGVLYISYNTLPGWSGFAPMRHLMTEHAEILGAEGKGVITRIGEAVTFAKDLLAVNPKYAAAAHGLSDKIDRIQTQPPHYLAHEYFNRDWHPMYFAEMADWLREAKLDYVASANCLNHLDFINLTADQQAFLNDIPDRYFRESVRGMIVNEQFRAEYWVKGPIALTGLEQAEQLRATQILLTVPQADVTNTITGALGEATLSEELYDPIVDLLSDHQRRTIEDVERALSDQSSGDVVFDLPKIVQAIIVLVGAGYVSLVQDSATEEVARPRTDALNRFLFNKARSSSDVNWLASPVTGEGIAANRFEQMFTASYIHGSNSASEWAEEVWSILEAQGHRVILEGQQLESAEENIEEITRLAEEFESKRLPIFRALGIVT